MVALLSVNEQGRLIQRPTYLYPFAVLLVLSFAMLYCQHSSTSPLDARHKANLNQNITQQLDTKMNLPGLTVLSKISLRIKEGYAVKILSNSRFVVMKEKQKVTGSFECACQLQTGACDVLITPSNV